MSDVTRPVARRRRLDWVNRWIVAAALAWLAAVAAAGVLYFASFVPRERRLAVEAWEQRLEAVLDQRELTVNEWLGDAARGARYLAREPEIAAVLAAPAPERGSAIIAAPHTEVTSEADFAGLLVYGSGLELRAAAAGPAPLAGRCLDVAARAAAAPRQQPGVALCDGARPLALFAAPVPAPHGLGSAGVVVVTVDPRRWLYPALAAEWAPSTTGETLLVGSEGDAIVYLSPLRHSAAPPAALRLPSGARTLAAAATAAGPLRPTVVVDYRGARVLAAGRSLAGARLALVAKVDEAEVLASYGARVREVGSIAAAVLLVLAAAGIALWRGARASHYKALAAGRAEIAELFEHGPDAGLAIVDGRITAANRAAGELFACPPDALVGMFPWQLNPPAQADGSSSETALRDWLGRLEPGERRRLDWRCRRLDGSEFDAEISVAVVAGTPPRALAWLRDVSEERALRERLRLLVEGSSLFFFYVQELDGTLSYVSPAVERITGHGVAEWRARTDWFVTDNPVNQTARRRTHEHLRGEIDGLATFVEVRHADGHPVTLEVYEFGRYSGTRLLGLHGIAHDVTERVRAAEALLRSEGRFRTLVTSLGEGVGVVDPDERIVHANPAAERIFGVPPGGLANRSLGDFVRPESLERIRRETGRRRNGEVGSYEIEVVRPDGAPRTVLVTATPQTTGDGEFQGAFGIFRDVTEARQLEQILRQAQKMEAVGRLAGGIAHDFNNLLQAMLGLSQTLDLHAGDTAATRAAGRELGEHVRRGASLARQLLLFSRRETTRFEVLDLNGLLERGVGLLRRLVRENVDIRLETPSQPLPVRGDPGQLEQVLINLAVNAADAMPEGGTLTIRAGEYAGGAVGFEVSDTGHGVPEPIRSRIFEPFFTTKSADKGTGLGLSVVHGIVAAHQGQVQMESEEARGSTFRVTLPRAGPPAAEEIQAGGIRDGLAPGAGGERILLVEDERATRESLVELLTVLDYRVTAVESGEQAGLLPVEPAFDLLLTDFLLPGISGADLARGLADRWPGLKVVLMSGYTEDDTVRADVRAGSVRFLQKPFSIDTLARELRTALDS